MIQYTLIVKQILLGVKLATRVYTWRDDLIRDAVTESVLLIEKFLHTFTGQRYVGPLLNLNHSKQENTVIFKYMYLHITLFKLSFTVDKF